MPQNISLDSFGPSAPLFPKDYLPYYPAYRPPSTKVNLINVFGKISVVFENLHSYIFSTKWIEIEF